MRWLLGASLARARLGKRYVFKQSGTQIGPSCLGAMFDEKAQFYLIIAGAVFVVVASAMLALAQIVP